MAQVEEHMPNGIRPYVQTLILPKKKNPLLKPVGLIWKVLYHIFSDK
jgi:hypothetical protein